MCIISRNHRHFEKMGQNNYKHIIREVRQFPEPFVVLASDQQLCDLEPFCCDDTEFVPRSVDPIFKFGKFKNNNPIVWGPMLIHFSKTEQMYT